MELEPRKLAAATLLAVGTLTVAHAATEVMNTPFELEQPQTLLKAAEQVSHMNVAAIDTAKSPSKWSNPIDSPVLMGDLTLLLDIVATNSLGSKLAKWNPPKKS